MKSSNERIRARAAPASRSTHGLKAAGLATPSALSGRKAGYTRVLRPACLILSWASRESAGSSVVQMTATRFAARMSCTRRVGSRSFARAQIESALAGPIRESIPKYRRSSRCDQW